MVISNLNIKLLEDRLRAVNETLMRLKRLGTLIREIKGFLENYQRRLKDQEDPNSHRSD